MSLYSLPAFGIIVKFVYRAISLRTFVCILIVLNVSFSRTLYFTLIFDSIFVILFVLLMPAVCIGLMRDTVVLLIVAVAIVWMFMVMLVLLLLLLLLLGSKSRRFYVESLFRASWDLRAEKSSSTKIIKILFLQNLQERVN